MYHLEWPFKKFRIKKGGKIKILSHILVIIPTKEHDKPFQKSRCMPIAQRITYTSVGKGPPKSNLSENIEIVDELPQVDY